MSHRIYNRTPICKRRRRLLSWAPDIDAIAVAPVGVLPRPPRFARAIVGGLAGLVWATATIGTVRAQTSFAIGGGASLAPPSVYTGRPDLFGNPGRGEEGLPIGNWLLFPSAFAGVVFATNPSESAVGGRASPGIRLTTNSYAQTDDGIKKTVLYSNSNLDLYANSGAASGSSTNNLSTRTGVIETYQPFSDLIFNAQGDFTRQENYFSPLGVSNNLSSLNPTGVGVAPTSNPVPYNQLSASASVQKNFSNSFVIISGSVVDLTYDQSSTTVAPSPNGVTYTGTGRGGFWIIPDLYGYLEASLDKRAYATSALSSTGYRTVAGLGSDRIGLFRGELYAGFQAENYNSAATGTTNGPLFGGRGSYFPLPELTINASVDETIGASLLATTPTSPAGTSTKVTNFLAQANYALAPEWTASGRGGVTLTTYGGSSRRDDAWAVGTTVTYSVWRSFGITCDYQHTALSSNVPLTGFTNDVFTLGVSYKY
jgi:hypothetical protein